MAATIRTSCPKCQKKLQLADTLKGKKIRCKDCGTVFPVPAEEEKPTAPKPASVKEEKKEGSAGYGLAGEDAEVPAAAASAAPGAPVPMSKAYGVTHEEDAARCPFCTNKMESEDAIVCLNCGYNTRTRTRTTTKRVEDITGADKFWWLLPGIIRVVLVFFVLFLGSTVWFGWFGLSRTYAWIREELGENPDGTGVGVSMVKGIRWWFIFGCMFALYKCIRFAVERLILHPTPPEMEIKGQKEKKGKKKGDEEEEEDDE